MKTAPTPTQKEAQREHIKRRVAICLRWEQWLNNSGEPNPDSRLDLLMTLDFADKDCGIDFDKLLASDDFTFVHDMSGMLHHMNRSTCKLENCFLPRCSR